MSTGDVIGLAGLLVSTVTAIAASYLAFLALQHSAKPQLKVVWQRPSQGPLHPSFGHDGIFIFDVFNPKIWYARPIARDIVLQFECPWYFSTVRLLKRGVGGIQEAEAESEGSHSELVLESLPFTLHCGEKAKFALEVVWMSRLGGGNGSIDVKAQTSDGAAYRRSFPFDFTETSPR
jgi:hypothetical protein